MKTISVPHAEANAMERLTHGLLYFLNNVQREIVILCIGTDRSTGDALGPMIGSQLRKLPTLEIPIYGHLDEPVHALNLAETIAHIERNHRSPYIIAVDACLGRLPNVGMVNIGEGPLRPGAGVHKTLPEIGDIHITGNVNVGGFMEFLVLQNTRLSLVVKMADTIAASIAEAIIEKKRLRTNPFRRKTPVIRDNDIAYTNLTHR